MMCSRVLIPEKEIKHGKLYNWSERGFQQDLDGYRRSLTWVLDHPALILIVFVLTLALNVFLMAKIPKGFFPQQDTGVVMGGMQGPQDTSFYAMREAVQQSVNIIKADPGVENVMGFTGGQGATNSGNGSSRLSRSTERKVSAAQIIARLRPKLARDAGRGHVSAGRAGHPHRRPAIQRRVPIHAAGRDTRICKSTVRNFSRSCSKRRASRT